MKEPIEIGEFMVVTNLQRLIVSGLRASAAAHPGCIDLRLSSDMAETIAFQLVSEFQANPTDTFMAPKNLEYAIVKGIRERRNAGLTKVILGGSIAKRIRMAILQSYDSRVRGIDTSGRRILEPRETPTFATVVGD